MTSGLTPRLDWLRVLRRYLVATLVGHVVWEIGQLPLYTLWTEGTLGQQVFAILHCTIGDIMIAGLALLLALALVGRATWPDKGALRVYVASLMLGVGYTIFSEWLNVNVRQSWTYSDLMPVVPIIGTGLAPLLQWVVVPTVVFAIALCRLPWQD